jgi:hypothetical protein
LFWHRTDGHASVAVNDTQSIGEPWSTFSDTVLAA